MFPHSIIATEPTELEAKVVRRQIIELCVRGVRAPGSVYVELTTAILYETKVYDFSVENFHSSRAQS